MEIFKNKITVLLALPLFLFASFGILSYCKSPLPAKQAPLDEAVTEPAEKLGRAFAAVARHIRPSVVSVFSEKIVKLQSRDFPFPLGEDLFGQFFGEDLPVPRGRQQPKTLSIPMRGMGSGILLERKGTILTNFHVVEGFSEIKVQMADGSEYQAKVKGSDARSDVAVLEMKSKAPENWPAATMGDSDKLKVGDLVLAVGAPFGLAQTVTQGVISATGRANLGITDFEDFLQTDTPINPGNSGGPLVNMRGEVVGVNTAIAAGMGQFSGVGFAIPSNMVNAMLPSLIKGESITRGQLGIGIQDLTPELARQFGLRQNGGVLVGSVAKGSAAEKAGLQVGDLVIEYGGKEIRDAGQLRNLVAGTAPGTTVKLKVVRNGKEEEISATVKTLKEEASERAEKTLERGASVESFGVEVEELPVDLRRQIRVVGGVLVTGVQDGSPAAISGIFPDDVIVQVDRKPVKGVRDFKRLIAASERKGAALLLINRKGASIFVVVRQGSE